jgi:hypothetical protein
VLRKPPTDLWDPRARRMKCDETKPRCKACLKSLRSCQWKRKPPSTTRPLLPQSSTQPSSAQPSLALHFVDEREAPYFQSYQDEVATELAGALGESPWRFSVLQACRTEPFVLRAVVAIGALNKSIKMQRFAAVGPVSMRRLSLQASSEHREFALASYAKAIRGMRQITLGPDKASSLRQVLLACLLVYCMETFLQSPNTAFIHSRAGCELLQQWVAESPKRDTWISSPCTSVVEDELFHEYVRLGMDHALRWGEKELQRHQRLRLAGTDTVKKMPSEFKSLGEARAYQQLVVQRTFHLISETHARIMAANKELRHLWTADGPGELVDPCYIPTVLLAERDEYLLDLKRWREAFAPILPKLANSGDQRLAVGAMILQSQVLDAEISLAGAFFTSECSFDSFLSAFIEILALTSRSLNICHDICEDMRPAFNIASDFERPLCNVVTNCRDKRLRHQALAIMRGMSPRDAAKDKTRRITRVQYLVALEEEGRQADGTIPEIARYRIIWILNHNLEASRRLTVICARRTGYPLGEMYPATREYKKRTFTQHEAENLIVGDLTSDSGTSPWPVSLPKPNFLKWREVHEELLHYNAHDTGPRG